jgi:hypothetical protein
MGTPPARADDQPLPEKTESDLDRADTLTRARAAAGRILDATDDDPKEVWFAFYKLLPDVQRGPLSVRDMVRIVSGIRREQRARGSVEMPTGTGASQTWSAEIEQEGEPMKSSPPKALDPDPTQRALKPQAYKDRRQGRRPSNKRPAT